MPIAENPVREKNLGLVERWAAIGAGTALISYGMKKRSKGGVALAILGGDMVYRGTTGFSPFARSIGIRPPRELLGEAVSIPYQQGIRIDKSITVGKPVEEVYAFWRDLGNLPRFMRHVHGVNVIDEKHSHWILCGPGDKVVEFDVEINSEEPNKRIGWRSITGSDVDTAGSVQFKPAPGGRGTETRLELQYLPKGGALGALLIRLMAGDPAKHIAEDLKRFKQVMETGEMATTEGQSTGKHAAFRREPSRARRARGTASGNDKVGMASDESFPASDPPSWTAPHESPIQDRRDI
jgi:uncharacterized membrane protein